MSRNSKIAEELRVIRALPPEPSNRGKRIAVDLLLGVIFVLLLAVGVLLHGAAPRVAGPIAAALS